MALELLADIMILFSFHSVFDENLLLEKDFKLRFKRKGNSLCDITSQAYILVFSYNFNIIKHFYVLSKENFILFFVS